jgi:hypothetical protein
MIVPGDLPPISISPSIPPHDWWLAAWHEGVFVAVTAVVSSRCMARHVSPQREVVLGWIVPIPTDCMAAPRSTEGMPKEGSAVPVNVAEGFVQVRI